MFSFSQRAKLIFLLFFGIQLSISAQILKKKKSADDVQLDQKEQAEYIFTEGMKDYTTENYSKAFDAFERSLAIDKSNAAAYYMIAQIYIKQNNLYKALEFSQKAVEINPNNKYYYIQLANIFERKQDFAEAAKVYLSLLKRFPNLFENYYDLAAVYLHQGKYDDAIKCYDKIEKQIGITEELVFQKRELYLKQKKVNDAINESKKLISAFPDEQRYVMALVELLIFTEKYDDAIKIANDLLSKDPLNPSANFLLYQIYSGKGETKKAHEKLMIVFKSTDFELETKMGVLIAKINQMRGDEEIRSQCIQLSELLPQVHPKEARAFAIYADVLAISMKNQEALANYLKAKALDNSHNRIWQQILILDTELNLIDSLVKHSESALELFPNQSNFWFYNGLGYQFKKNYRKSVTAFEQGKKLASNDTESLIRFNTLLGDSYNGLKDFVKSDQCFDEVLRFDENNYVVLNNYSYYLSLRKDKLQQAKQMSERVIKEFPDNATYVDTYAWILYVMKEYAKAKDYFEKIAGNSTNGTIVEHYGDVLYQLGQNEKALEQWKKAKSLGETSDLIEKKIADKKLYE